jgi:hypothetical protein
MSAPPCLTRVREADELQFATYRMPFPVSTTLPKPFKPTRTLLIGGDGIALDEFLAQPVEHWLP